MIRVLLVQPPFFRLESPCLGLELLHASLRRAGIASEVAYLNLELGRRIGAEDYTWIACRSPRYLLFADLIFAPALHRRPIPQERIEALVSGLGPRREAGLPDRLVARYPELVEAARDLVDSESDAIAAGGYDLVGIGTLFHLVPALALARAIKERPRAPRVLLGGSHCEGELGEAIHRAFPFVDLVCRGEGEELIVELARRLEAGRALDGTVGLIFREAGQTCGLDSGRATIGASAPRTEHPLDRLPTPRYDAWLERVRGLGLFAPEALRLPVETSRGCWYGERRHCLYCGFTGEAMRFRRKSPARILEELRTLWATGVRFLHWVDNIPDPRAFDTVLAEVAAERPEAQLFLEVMSSLDHRQVMRLREAGVRWVQVGIESLSTRLLRLMRKGTTALLNVRFLRYAAEHGIGASWSLLFGFVGEAPEDYRAIEALVPALAHLQPPYQDHQQVRVDRFSPLHLERSGIKDVVPAPAYRELFADADPETVARLAYYFDYAYVEERDPYAYTRGCAEAMERWRRGSAQAALVSYRAGDALHLVDTRPIANERRVALRGLGRDLLLAAEHGASLGALAHRTGASRSEVEAALESLLARRLILALDGRYLSLPVPVDGWIPAGVPPLLVEDAIVAAYCERMVRLRDGFYAADARPA